jgi:hypothetical protein
MRASSPAPSCSSMAVKPRSDPAFLLPPNPAWRRHGPASTRPLMVIWPGARNVLCAHMSVRHGHYTLRKQPFRFLVDGSITRPSRLQLPPPEHHRFSFPYSRQSIGHRHRARAERRLRQSDGTAVPSAGLRLRCTSPFGRTVAKGEKLCGCLLPCGVTATSKTLSSCHALPDHFPRTLS